MGRLFNHCIGAIEEPNGNPSSARIYAGILLVTIPVIQLMVVLAVMARLATLNPSLSNVPTLTSSYLGFLKSFLLWTLLFNAGTAMSLYGINVWKYISSIRTGVAPLPEADDGSTTTNSSSSPVTPQVVPAATTNGSSSETPAPDVDHT